MKNKIVAFVLSVVGMGCSFALKANGYITEPTFLALIMLSVLIGLFISYSDKVQSVNLQKGELILKEIKETETTVKDLAKAILAVTETSNHGMMLESFDSGAHGSAIERLRKLAT